jgi:hypothetical protein
MFSILCSNALLEVSQRAFWIPNTTNTAKTVKHKREILFFNLNILSSFQHPFLEQKKPRSVPPSDDIILRGCVCPGSSFYSFGWEASLPRFEILVQ